MTLASTTGGDRHSESGSSITSGHPHQQSGLDSALAAWRNISPSDAAPSGVEVLRDGIDSLVLRIRGAGPNGSDLIAKHSSPDRLARAIGFDKLLRSSHSPEIGRAITPLCYGWAAGQDGREWLFQQDAGGTKFRRSEHTALLSRSIAALHRDFAGRSIEKLPPAGPPRHHAEALTALGLLASVSDREFEPRQVERLRHLQSAVEQVLDRWKTVEDLCDGLPSTVTHGDLQPQNVRVLEPAEDPRVVILDWEWAGAGAPAIDLASRCVDLQAYGSVSRGRLGQLSPTDLERLRHVGRLFRHIFWIERALNYLAAGFEAKAWSYLADDSFDQTFHFARP